MAEHAGNRGLFLDLVGTLVGFDANRELPLVDGRIKIELLPGVAEKLRPIRDHFIFVVTNQAGIARGRLTLAQVEAALSELDALLGGIVTDSQICPHVNEDGCDCRKPAPGMIRELAAIYGVDLANSTMVGDQAIDEQCARAAGIGHFVYAREFFAPG